MAHKPPPGWGPEMALSLARDNPGQALPFVLQRIAGELEKCEWQRLVRDVFCWRAQDPAFAEQLVALEPKRDTSSPLDVEPGMEEWKVRFAEVYLRERDRLEAARQVGLSWAHIRKTYLSSKSPSYDPFFAQLVNQVESYFIAGAEADVQLGIRIARETADAKTLIWGSLEWLRARSRRKWGKEQTIKHEGQVKHVHEHRVSRAIESAQERSKRLFGRAAAALPPAAERASIEKAITVKPERVQ